MSAAWTVAQIVALAGSASVRRASLKLADSSEWTSLKRSDKMLWGEITETIKGRATGPYQVQITLDEQGAPTFHCSCAARKRPCKHGVALLLRAAQQPLTFSPSLTDNTPDELNNDLADPRFATLAAGMRELSLWLRDRVRGGLSTMQGQNQNPGQNLGQNYSVWESIAARMMDAHAPGVAARLRRLSTITASGEDWPSRLLEQLSRLYLLAEGFERYAELTPEMRTDMRAVIGWTSAPRQDNTHPALEGRWLVLGSRLETEPDTTPAEGDDDFDIPAFLQEPKWLYHRWLWLYGLETERLALVKHTTGSERADKAFAHVATILEASVLFAPGGYPLNATFAEPPAVLVVESNALADGLKAVVGHTAIRAAMSAYSNALACNPWLDTFPLALNGVTPARQGKGWIIGAEDGALPVSPRFEQGWHLLAMSGGQPIALFGEWDGAALLPLSAWIDDRFMPFKA